MGPVRQNPIQRTVSLFICVCITLCTIVAHNIAQNRPDSFPTYPPDNHHCSDDVYLREGGPKKDQVTGWFFSDYSQCFQFPSVNWHWWFGQKNGIWLVNKTSAIYPQRQLMIADFAPGATQWVAVNNLPMACICICTIMWKHDVIHETGRTQHVALSPEDWATATDNKDSISQNSNIQFLRYASGQRDGQKRWSRYFEPLPGAK